VSEHLFVDPPAKCDLCGEPLTTVFIDGKTSRGVWAYMCLECWKTKGVGLGVGKGQKYEKTAEGWIKKEG